MATNKSNDVPIGQAMIRELGIDASVWHVIIGYTKGVFDSSRGANVCVIHKPSGRVARQHLKASSKAKARKLANEFVIKQTNK